MLISTADPKPAGDGVKYRYWAFISYSHKDAAPAKRLHATLETWPVPKKWVDHATPVGNVPPRLSPIFLDRDEIAGGESLDSIISAALELSRYLIVVCSPHSAASKYVNEEIRIFKTLGRSARIIYLIVSGEPENEPSSGDQSRNCFPVMAYRQVRADGTLGGQMLAPVAPDARAGKDGWRDAVLKVLAQLLSVDFDQLKNRELQRIRRKRTLAVALVSVIGALGFIAYALGADAGLAMPFCEDLRIFLDRHELSVFRHVPSSVEIQSAAHTLYTRLAAELLKKRQPDGWINDAPIGTSPYVSLISHGQAMAALFCRRNASDDESKEVFASLDLLFDDKLQASDHGAKVGWMENGQTLPFAPYCVAIALCEALGEAPARENGVLRAKLMRHWDDTREMLEHYHQADTPGAWNLYPSQTDPKQHSVYASVLALLALLEARQSGVALAATAEQDDALIRETSRWLLAQYHSTAVPHGWLNDPIEEHLSDVFDGLTAEAYAALLEAEESGAGVELPAAMYEHIRDYLVKCDGRSLDYASDVSAYRIVYRHNDGTVSDDKETFRYASWPWIIRCGELWLRYADRHHLPPEQRAEVRRTMAHFIIKLGPQEVEKETKGYSYMLSEDLFCLRNSFVEK